MMILFRGIIYRFAINYRAIGTRTEIKITNKELIEKINIKSEGRKVNFKEILEIADEITNEELTFTINKASNNPNELINTKRANCVGYSAMFNSITNHLIRKKELENRIEASHKIGQLDLFGINLHQFFENSFFKDHDFNVIKNKETDEVISIDPSISDYLIIKTVN